MLASPEAPSAFQRLADDLAAALDPVVFVRALGLEPDPWQAEVLRSSSRRILLNCSRQSGKSTITAAIGLHQAIYVPGSLILLLAPTREQAAELFRKLSDLYAATGGTVSPKAQSVLRLELENGSRVLTLPAKEASVRGYSGAALLVFDEASRVPESLYAAVRPILATSGGRLIAMSTPFGNRGWWYEAWRSAEPWDRYEVPADRCPRISPEFLEEERRNLGQWWFEQEYQCQFLDAETQAFRTEDVENAFDDIEQWEL